MVPFLVAGHLLYQCSCDSSSQAGGAGSLRGPLDVVEEIHEADKVSDELLGLPRRSQLPLTKPGGLIGKKEVATTPVLLRLKGEKIFNNL